MKTIPLSKPSILYLFCVLTFALAIQSCDSDNGPDTGLMGQWLLIQRYDGGGIDPVNDGKTITFGEDTTFKDSFLPDCNGTFFLEKDTITINRPCHDEPIRYLFSLDKNKLVLLNIPSSCDEGCYDIFKRI